MESSKKDYLLYSALIGAIAGSLIPTVGDAVYFAITKRNRDEFNRGEITAKQYWVREMLAYYLSNGLWWIAVALLAYMLDAKAEHKAKIISAVIGAGAIVGYMIKTIEQDKQVFDLNKERQKVWELYQEYKAEQNNNKLSQQ